MEIMGSNSFKRVFYVFTFISSGYHVSYHTWPTMFSLYLHIRGNFSNATLFTIYVAIFINPTKNLWTGMPVEGENNENPS